MVAGSAGLGTRLASCSAKENLGLMGNAIGIVANPVSARDIRRVIANATALQITDRANIVLRVLSCAMACGVGKVYMMPENGGIRHHVRRGIDRAESQGQKHFPDLEYLDYKISGTVDDTLRAARMNPDIARNNVSKTKSEKFAPTINLIGENKYKNDVEGTIGQRHEQLVKVEMKYSFNLGFTAINTLKASEHTLSATENRYGDAMDTTIEQSKNSWNELNTSRRNAEHLRNQANIAAEFLELARKERALGRRSLIDVLSGETRLINASSDAASAETDVAISVFKLLAVMGKLDETVVK